MPRMKSSRSPARKRLALLVAAGVGWATLGGTAPAAAAVAVAQNGQGCTVLGTLANDLLVVRHARDVVCGLGGNDTIIGGSGADVLDGGAGNDVLVGGAGADVLLGGSGADTVSYDDHSDTVTVDLDGQADDGSAGEGDRVAVDVENVVGGPGRDSLTGSAGPDTLRGGGGDDTLRGGGGNDQVHGQGGNDRVHGEDGNDQISGQDGDDALDGGAGDDVVDGGAGRDDLEGGSGLNTCIADAQDGQVVDKCTDTRNPHADMTSLGWVADPAVDNSANRTVKLRLSAGDDRSGLTYVWVKLRGPGAAAQTLTLGFGSSRLLSGTTTNGTWELTGVLPALSAVGAWTVSEVYVQDRVSRYTRYTVKPDGSYTGSAYGYAGVIGLAPLVVTGVADQDAPVADLAAAVWTGATTLDNAADRMVTLRLPVTDDLSGVAAITASLNATGTSDGLTLRLASARLVSGTAVSGVWEVTGAVPAFTPAGDWQVSALSLTDRVGHVRTVRPGADAATTLLRISGVSDLQAPTADLSSAEYVGSTTADNAADRKVTMRMRLGDDVSGVASVFFDYRTVGAQSRLDPVGPPDANGVWTLAGTLRATTTPGQWRVVGVYITDRVGRQRIYDVGADGRYTSRDGSLSGTATLPAFTLTPCGSGA